MKKVLAVFLVMALFLGACAGEKTNSTNEATGESSVNVKNDVEAIQKRGKLIVATSADYPPYEFTLLKDGKTEFVGFDMELAKYIAKELGVELEIRDMDFKNVIGAVTSGMADIALAGLSPKADRTEVAFSDIYYHATQGVLIRIADKDLYNAKEDLEDKKLGVQLGSIQEEIGAEIKGAKLSSLPLVTALIQELKTNKVNALILEKPVAAAYAKANPELMVVEGIEMIDDAGGSAVAIGKNNLNLQKKINEILAKVKEENLLETWIVEANKLQEKQGD